MGLLSTLGILNVTPCVEQYYMNSWNIQHTPTAETHILDCKLDIHVHVTSTMCRGSIRDHVHTKSNEAYMATKGYACQ